MRHWTKLDHVTFLLMIIPILALLLTSEAIPVLVFAIILLILWFIALVFDLYESVQDRAVKPQ